MSNKLIHIVDDDAASRASMQALVMSLGYKAAVYHSAEEYLAAFEKCACGCLVIDVRLDGMSGLHLQRVLPSRGEAPPIIMVSGHADVAVRNEAMANGALAVLEKPFDAKQLLEWITIATSSCAETPETSV